MDEIKKEWVAPLLRCSETAFVADEETKTLLWSNDPAVKAGETCYRAFFGRETPCPSCPKLQEDALYIWESYDRHQERWLKVKSLLSSDGERLCRFENFNSMNDAMELANESLRQISILRGALNENQRVKRLLEDEAFHDRMTGLYNRNRFNLDVAAGIFDRERTGILFFDINNLKQVNDEKGHQTGDTLILALAGALRETASYAETTCAYRIGGDEFVLVLLGTSEEHLGETRSHFQTYLAAHQPECPCEVAVGYALSQKAQEAEKLLFEADGAMYLEKQRMKGLSPEKPQ